MEPNSRFSRAPICRAERRRNSNRFIYLLSVCLKVNIMFYVLQYNGKYLRTSMHQCVKNWSMPLWFIRLHSVWTTDLRRNNAILVWFFRSSKYALKSDAWKLYIRKRILLCANIRWMLIFVLATYSIVKTIR